MKIEENNDYYSVCSKKLKSHDAAAVEAFTSQETSKLPLWRPAEFSMLARTEGLLSGMRCVLFALYNAGTAQSKHSAG